MIIESEKNEPVQGDDPFDHQGPDSQHDQVPGVFSTFLAIYQQIRDDVVHTQLQNDLVDHL
jgi:hypothetical protein